MSEPQAGQQRRGSHRNQKLQQIEALYRSQIKQIHSKDKPHIADMKKSISPQIRNADDSKPTTNPLISHNTQNTVSQIRSATHLNSVSSTSRLLLLEAPDERARASTLLRGESARTIEMFRKQNQTKELKIRQLTNKCQFLVDKLKKYLSSQEFEDEVLNLKQFSEGKVERMQNLLKIKNQQILFRIKLEVVNLLQQFGFSKEQLADVSQIDSQGPLFSLLARKLKSKLKDYRSKQQESSFVQQKDRILSEKQEQRIHFLTETNQLLKLSQNKLKAKIDDLKSQLNQYLEIIKQRETQKEECESQTFLLRRQNDQLNSNSSKLSAAVKALHNDKIEEKRLWEAKEKQMKLLLNNYFIQKKKLQAQLEEKQEQAEELIIKQKFLEQQNERLNRQLVRWKERFNWLEKEKENNLRQMEEDKTNILNQFQNYKMDNNQGILMSYRSDIEEAQRKIQQYQQAYQNVLQQLQDEKRLLQRSQEQAQTSLDKLDKDWIDKIKKLTKAKDDELAELQHESELKIAEIKQQFQQKERLLVEEMQARMKSLLAQKDKKNTELTISLESQNDELRSQINNLMKVLQVKESLINVISSKKSIGQ